MRWLNVWVDMLWLSLAAKMLNTILQNLLSTMKEDWPYDQVL